MAVSLGTSPTGDGPGVAQHVDRTEAVGLGSQEEAGMRRGTSSIVWLQNLVSVLISRIRVVALKLEEVI